MIDRVSGEGKHAAYADDAQDHREEVFESVRQKVVDSDSDQFLPAVTHPIT